MSSLKIVPQIRIPQLESPLIGLWRSVFSKTGFLILCERLPGNPPQDSFYHDHGNFPVLTVLWDYQGHQGGHSAGPYPTHSALILGKEPCMDPPACGGHYPSQSALILAT